eukprot:1150870-Pelagomonas_calceolata.AAC.12
MFGAPAAAAAADDDDDESESCWSGLDGAVTCCQGWVWGGRQCMGLTALGRAPWTPEQGQSK